MQCMSPAYRYGYELGTHERYRGQDWAALEADARREWEARHRAPGRWGAIRYGWENAHARTSGLMQAGPGTASAVPGVAPTVRRNFHIPTDSYANAVPGKFHAVGVQACLHGRFSGSPRGLGCQDQLAP